MNATSLEEFDPALDALKKRLIQEEQKRKRERQERREKQDIVQCMAAVKLAKSKAKESLESDDPVSMYVHTYIDAKGSEHTDAFKQCSCASFEDSPYCKRHTNVFNHPEKSIVDFNEIDLKRTLDSLADPFFEPKKRAPRKKKPNKAQKELDHMKELLELMKKVVVTTDKKEKATLLARIGELEGDGSSSDVSDE